MLRITISGDAGEGKTTLLRLVVKALRDADVLVAVTDERPVFPNDITVHDYVARCLSAVAERSQKDRVELITVVTGRESIVRGAGVSANIAKTPESRTLAEPVASLKDANLQMEFQAFLDRCYNPLMYKQFVQITRSWLRGFWLMALGSPLCKQVGELEAFEAHVETAYESLKRSDPATGQIIKKQELFATWRAAKEFVANVPVERDAD